MIPTNKTKWPEMARSDNKWDEQISHPYSLNHESHGSHSMNSSHPVCGPSLGKSQADGERRPHGLMLCIQHPDPSTSQIRLCNSSWANAEKKTQRAGFSTSVHPGQAPPDDEGGAQVILIAVELRWIVVIELHLRHRLSHSKACKWGVVVMHVIWCRMMKTWC